MKKSDKLWDSIGIADAQEISSAHTSINKSKIPAGFKLIDWKHGMRNADIGGGAYTNATEWLEEKGVINIVYDPYNISHKYNERAAQVIRDGQCDSVTCFNVLNVIKNINERGLVIAQAANALKETGTAYFYIYEGDGSCIGKKTKKDCWQNNLPTEHYVIHVSTIFNSVRRKDRMIIASNPDKEVLDLYLKTK